MSGVLERTLAVLTTLHSLSCDRQIVLFTQEAAVLSWAETHLAAAADSLIRLQPAPEPTNVSTVATPTDSATVATR